MAVVAQTEEIKFANLNPYQGLDFLTADSADNLLNQLQQISSPIKIISIYSVGFKHFAWFMADVKIKKINKGK